MAITRRYRESGVREGGRGRKRVRVRVRPVILT